MLTQEVATPGAAEEVLRRSGEVVQLFRRPGLSQSATKTLLRKVRLLQAMASLLSLSQVILAMQGICCRSPVCSSGTGRIGN